MEAYEDGVDARRQKLRELVLREEIGLIREVVDRAQHGDDHRMEEMRRKAEELRDEQEKQRVALVAAKRMQQRVVGCTELREKLVKKITAEAKSSNLAQMADNEAKRLAEKELDDLWHGLMLKEVEAKEEREVEEKKKRSLADKEVAETLANQVAGKLAMEETKKKAREEERERLERLSEELRREEASNLERERRNREKLKTELQEQILNAKRGLAERSRREAELDRLYASVEAEKLSKERASIKESSETLRRELLAYMRYLEDIRKEEARRSLEVDAIIEQSSKDAAARRDLATKKFKEVRQEGLREVLRGREEQLRIKREKELEELERSRAEKELLEKEVEQEAKLSREKREEERRRTSRYARELEEQKKRAEEKKRREAEEDKEILREQLRREEEDKKLTEELLIASENITPHPFKLLLEQSVARYADEKEGLCHCPPSLSPE